MDSYAVNKAAWDRAVTDGANPYTCVVSPAHIAAARQGTWSVYVSDGKPVPHAWFPTLDGLPVLCLASGGGQQAPILAALGPRSPCSTPHPANSRKTTSLLNGTGWTSGSWRVTWPTCQPLPLPALR